MQQDVVQGDVITKNFALRLKSRREMMNMSLYTLSLAADIRVDVIDAIERGRQEADTLHLFQLASALRVSPNYFFHGLPSLGA